MAQDERVLSVLIVSASEKFNSSLRSLLPETDYKPVRTVGSVGEAQRLLNNRVYDIIIINTPLPDDFGKKIAIDVCIHRNTVAMLLVKGEIYEEIYDKVVGYGVMVMRKPVSTASMHQALDWMRSMSERLCGLEKKTVTLEEKMSEIRIVNRAKWALIETCKMTEADAHRFIEKQAMDRCVTRREIAEGILNTYC